MDDSSEENILMVDAEAAVREGWPMSPPVGSSAPLWVSPPSFDKYHAGRVMELVDGGADRWMLPVDLKGQCSNPLRLNGFFFTVNKGFYKGEKAC